MDSSKIDVGIIGTGKIGTDLLFKILKSPHLNCSLFVGRNNDSEGIKQAKQLGIKVSDRSVDAFGADPQACDLVFDATSASGHRENAAVFDALGIKVIDLTPAQIGPFCIPTINANQILQCDNVNLVTCGGQASIPVLNVVSSLFSNIEYIGIESHLAEDSVGQATLDNIDDYFETTASAISVFTGVDKEHVGVDLSVEKSAWKPDMLTTLRVKIPDADIHQLFGPLQLRLAALREYVPGYNIVGTPSYRDDVLEILVSIRGQGDWIPEYAGNLDIINSAAIHIAEMYATHVLQKRPPVQMGIHHRLANLFRAKEANIEPI